MSDSELHSGNKVTHVFLSLSARTTSLIKLGNVTSESQNNPVSTNGVNSAMTLSVRILRKVKKSPKS
jgi:hypothetical protein